MVEEIIYETSQIKLTKGINNGVWVHDVEKNCPVSHLTTGQLKDIAKALLCADVV